MENIKKIINYEALTNLFSSFHKVSGLDVMLYDINGVEQVSCCSSNNICNIIRNDKCKTEIISSGKISEKLSTPYIFETHCGLVRCICPVIIENQVLGYIALGPVSLWEIDDYSISEIKEKSKLSNFDFKTIQHVECDKMTGWAQMLSILVNYLAGEEKKYILKRKELERLEIERIIISEEFKLHERNANFSSYPNELEKELIAYVQLGEKKMATNIINNYLNQIFCYASGDLSIIKIKLYEFTAFLSRAAVEAGTPILSLTDIIKKSTNIITGEADFQNVCDTTIEIVNGFIDAVYDVRTKKLSSEYMAKAINYINNHYNEELTLKILSEKIFVSSYYLSHLFHDTLAITFNEYLNKVRITNAKKFLLEGKSIDEVCSCCGYTDTNYFIKIFKKNVGLTPAKYKKQFI